MDKVGPKSVINHIWRTPKSITKTKNPSITCGVPPNMAHLVVCCSRITRRSGSGAYMCAQW